MPTGKPASANHGLVAGGCSERLVARDGDRISAARLWRPSCPTPRLGMSRIMPYVRRHPGLAGGFAGGFLLAYRLM